MKLFIHNIHYMIVFIHNLIHFLIFLNFIIRMYMSYHSKLKLINFLYHFVEVHLKHFASFYSWLNIYILDKTKNATLGARLRFSNKQ